MQMSTNKRHVLLSFFLVLVGFLGSDSQTLRLRTSLMTAQHVTAREDLEILHNLWYSSVWGKFTSKAVKTLDQDKCVHSLSVTGWLVKSVLMLSGGHCFTSVRSHPAGITSDTFRTTGMKAEGPRRCWGPYSMVFKVLQKETVVMRKQIFSCSWPEVMMKPVCSRSVWGRLYDETLLRTSTRILNCVHLSVHSRALIFQQ